tara:strand:+ start:1675 stop:1938 length:264 start_codon:yes stop_codon:yes gene_type:complete
VAFLAPPEYVRRIYHQGMPTITLETAMGPITATARFIGRGDIMPRKVPLHIFPQTLRVRRHGKGPAHGQIRGTVHLPTALVYVDANE